MGNYYSNNIEQNSELYSETSQNTQSESLNKSNSSDYEQENHDKEYYLVCIDDKYYLSKSLDQAKIYLQSIINIDISNNWGYHIQVFEDEYENKIVYTLNRYDPTSLFCRYNHYCKYAILKVKSLPFPLVVDLQSNKKDN